MLTGGKKLRGKKGGRKGLGGQDRGGSFIRRESCQGKRGLHRSWGVKRGAGDAVRDTGGKLFETGKGSVFKGKGMKTFPLRRKENGPNRTGASPKETNAREREKMHQCKGAETQPALVEKGDCGEDTMNEKLENSRGREGESGVENYSYKGVSE